MKQQPKTILLIIFLLSLTLTASGQNYQKTVEKYYNSKTVETIFTKFEKQKQQIIEDWKKIAAIYSPSGNEILRAQFITKKFKEYNIPDAYIDKHGNSVALIEGGGEGPVGEGPVGEGPVGEGPAIVFLGTMDDLATVAEMVKEWKNPIVEREGKLIGPGTNIGSTCASILGLAKLFTLPEVKFNGKIYLVGVVQEETGLTGIKGFLDDHPGEIDYVVDIMSGIGSISYGAIGIHWFKVHFKGERGHTLRGGLPNVTRGVARAVDQIFSIPIPTEPPEKRSHLNIAMLGAGKVYNHKYDDGWFSVDLRSMDNETLLNIKQQIFTIAEKIAGEEKLEYWIEKFSEVPGGQIPGMRNSKFVRIAEEAVKILNDTASLSNRGSSNMNVGIGRQIPSISMGGNRGGGRDTPGEYANIEPAFQGVKANFLIAYVLTNGQIK